MKTIQKWQAVDGCEFTEERKCIDYENTINRVQKIIDRLPKPPEDDGCNFANGHGYIKHDAQTFISVWNDLLDEFATIIDHRWIKKSKDLQAHPSYVGRLVGDYNVAPYWKAWNRIQNTDIKTFREFGQPYFTSNPDKADLFEIKVVKHA